MRLWSPCRGWFRDMGWCLSQHLIRCYRARPACSPCCGEHAPARGSGTVRSPCCHGSVVIDLDSVSRLTLGLRGSCVDLGGGRASMSL